MIGIMEISEDPQVSLYNTKELSRVCVQELNNINNMFCHLPLGVSYDQNFTHYCAKFCHGRHPHDFWVHLEHIFICLIWAFCDPPTKTKNKKSKM